LGLNIPKTNNCLSWQLSEVKSSSGHNHKKYTKVINKSPSQHPNEDELLNMARSKINKYILDRLDPVDNISTDIKSRKRAKTKFGNLGKLTPIAKKHVDSIKLENRMMGKSSYFYEKKRLLLSLKQRITPYNAKFISKFLGGRIIIINDNVPFSIFKMCDNRGDLFQLNPNKGNWNKVNLCKLFNKIIYLNSNISLEFINSLNCYLNYLK
jgi:hypothetical protein